MVITPACGFVDATGAMIIGVLAAVVPYIFVMFVKGAIGYDDALDTFGVHAVGGTLGCHPDRHPRHQDVNGNLTAANSYAAPTASPSSSQKVVFSASSSMPSASRSSSPIVATIVIAMIVKAVIGLRPTAEAETAVSTSPITAKKATTTDRYLDQINDHSTGGPATVRPFSFAHVEDRLKDREDGSS